MLTRWKLTRWLGGLVVATASAPRVTTRHEGAPREGVSLRAGTLAFSAHATTGDFVGSTTVASGSVEGDLRSARGWVEARVTTLKTRNDLRDRDMRAALDASKYPTMRFDLARVEVHRARQDSALVHLHGGLTIHGATRSVDLPATIAFGGDSIHVVARFPLDVEDYGVGGLTKMFGLLRMDPRIEVRLDLVFDRPPDTAPRADYSR